MVWSDSSDRPVDNTPTHLSLIVTRLTVQWTILPPTCLSSWLVWPSSGQYSHPPVSHRDSSDRPVDNTPTHLSLIVTRLTVQWTILPPTCLSSWLVWPSSGQYSHPPVSHRDSSDRPVDNTPTHLSLIVTCLTVQWTILPPTCLSSWLVWPSSGQYSHPPVSHRDLSDRPVDNTPTHLSLIVTCLTVQSTILPPTCLSSWLVWPSSRQYSKHFHAQ